MTVTTERPDAPMTMIDLFWIFGAPLGLIALAFTFGARFL